MCFSPRERFRLPSGQVVETNIRLVPLADGEVGDPNEPGLDPGYIFEVWPDGGIRRIPLRDFCPGMDVVPPLEGTALTVDDLTSV